MINLRLAKSIMEREEGMNHLWIQLSPWDSSLHDKAKLRIALPDGLFRTPNLNRYEENDSIGILLDLSKDQDVLFELYTQSAVDCGKASIKVVLNYKDNHNNRKALSQEVSIQFVNEDEMDSLEIDEQVIERVKEIASHVASSSAPHNDLVNIRPRIYEIRSNEYAYLEKKYRLE